MSDAAPDPFPELGEVVDDHTVRFRRLLPVPIEVSWERVASPAGLASWLGPASWPASSPPLPPSSSAEVGRQLALRFETTGGPSGERGSVDAVVVTADAPGLLELTWHERPGPDVDTSLRVELDPVGSQSRLILTHRGLPVEQKYGYGAGWHQHLARLVAVLDGEADPGWDDLRQVNLSVAYRTEAGSAFPDQVQN